MSSDLPITSRNYHAKIVLISGTRVVLREVLFGEQVKLAGNRFATEVTPMQHGRFRLIQDKGGVRAPVDLRAQNVDRLTRRGANAPAGGLGPMPKPSPADADVFDLSHAGIPYSGRIEVFNGRGALHGTDEATGEAQVILLRDVQVMEVRRRKGEARQASAEEVAAYYDRPDEAREGASGSVIEPWPLPGVSTADINTAASGGTSEEHA
ncbi:MAG TPA: hypothetical protein VD997_00375 [Phycisphaerales bacterium]|nr:hypothetical protein [Phycisphaerales bacterium]